MKKQGFTLIELMVVIVIMGILAAVAVPKLFGQIAKSKASEVATNASTFKTALDSYAMTANGVGTAVQIGYDVPNSGKSNVNFTYAVPSAGNWTATAKIALNDCKVNSVWTLAGTFRSSTGKVTYTAAVGNGTSATANARDGACVSMTPGFEKLAD